MASTGQRAQAATREPELRSVAIVTGSAAGIGRELCRVFAARGVDVMGLDIDAGGNAETAADIGPAMAAITCDVSDAEAVKTAVADIVARTGRIDLLVNNAAVFNDTTLLGGTYDEQVTAWHRAMGACSDGAFHCTAAVAPTMVAGGGGNVVNLITDHIRPTHHLVGTRGTAYDATKFALWRLTEHWAVELRASGVRVNGLAFGATDTPMLRAVSARLADTAMRASDVADAVCAIVDQGPDGATGRVYDVGFTGTPRHEYLRQITAIATDI